VLLFQNFVKTSVFFNIRFEAVALHNKRKIEIEQILVYVKKLVSYFPATRVTYVLCLCGGGGGHTYTDISYFSICFMY
jgi:hypothetical protein